jgi:multisubunit Na+/H+ antiporter MnhB subunit
MATFKFSAYGILAVAALLFVLYFLAQTPQYPIENADPFLYLGAFIVVAFIVYIFLKNLRRY